MLTPRYTVRHLLLLVALCAVVCVVPALAARGHQWAVALAVALFAVVVLFAVSGFLYVTSGVLGAMLARLWAARKRRGGA